MVKNDIKVYARLKPEWSQKNITNHEVYHRPKGRKDEDFLILTAPPRICNEYIDNRPESWNFSFYNIFEETTKQEVIFNDVAKPVIHSVLDGYNGTIFAYGQTGSGKTYTITGKHNNYDLRGILPRTLQYLFSQVKKQTENLYSIEISYLEIYNENGYDLLNRKQEWSLATKIEDLPRVTIQEDETGTLHLKNLSFWPVTNEKDALDLLFIGDTNRVVSETPMNPMSSRSHCIFTIIVSMKKIGSNRCSRAKMHLVDLAGSERVYKCAITGTILTEAKHINLSLHYLEQVIVCLGQQNANHIPYRNSLLTAILRDSLGGNCLTTMLATLSLSIHNLEETISTCRFAQRVALVENDVNLSMQHDINSENTLLKMENLQLKKQIETLKNQLDGQVYSSRELNEDDKEYLDKSLDEFLESDGNFKYTNDPQKLHYCLEILRGKFKLHNYENGTKTICSQSSEYYKNLILQRDKEISLLINMLKKEKKKFSRQKLPKDIFQEKKNENSKANGCIETIENKSIVEHEETPKDTRTSVETNNNFEPKQISEEMPNFENNLITLTPQDVRQLKNLISMYNGHILSYHQSLVSDKHSAKVSPEQDFFASRGKFVNNKRENLFQNVDSIGKTVLENKLNSPENSDTLNIDPSLIKPNYNNDNSSSSSRSLEKINSSRNEQLSGTCGNSERIGSVKNNHRPEVKTLNLYQIVKEDLRNDGINSGKLRKRSSKRSSREEKRKSKCSSKFSLVSKSSSKESVFVERNNLNLETLVNNQDAGGGKNCMVTNDNGSVIIQGGGDAETIMSRSKDFISLENGESLQNHIDVAKDQSLAASSRKLESSQSTTSVKSEAHSANVTRLLELSKKPICINNSACHSSSNSNIKFLNSSKREISSSFSSSSSSASSSSFLSPPSCSFTAKNSTDLMHKFQANIIDSRIPLKSFNSPREKVSSLISLDNGSAINIERSAKELEEKFLAKNDDNLEEELMKLTENFSLSNRSSFYAEEKEEKVFDFDKSLPLTGDPDIDEEIIAFYKAKRTGGNY